MQQLVGILMIALITFLNTLGVRLGKIIQNIFTSAKTLGLVGLILVCVFVGRNAAAISDNFGHFWHIRGAVPIEPGASFLRGSSRPSPAPSASSESSWPSASPRSARCFPPTPGTTSASPPPK